MIFRGSTRAQIGVQFAVASAAMGAVCIFAAVADALRPR